MELLDRLAVSSTTEPALQRVRRLCLDHPDDKYAADILSFLATDAAVEILAVWAEESSQAAGLERLARAAWTTPEVLEAFRPVRQVTRVETRYKRTELRTHYPAALSAAPDLIKAGSLARRTQEGRDAVCASEDHPQAGSTASARAQRRERRVHPGRSSAKPAAPGDAGHARPTCPRGQCACLRRNHTDQPRNRVLMSHSARFRPRKSSKSRSARDWSGLARALFQRNTAVAVGGARTLNSRSLLHSGRSGIVRSAFTAPNRDSSICSGVTGLALAQLTPEGSRDGQGKHLADADVSTTTIDSNGTIVNPCRWINDTCAIGL